jgi:hypothetical protein
MGLEFTSDSRLTTKARRHRATEISLLNFSVSLSLCGERILNVEVQLEGGVAVGGGSIAALGSLRFSAESTANSMK